MSVPRNPLNLPDMVFSRMMPDLICVRLADGRFEKLSGGGPWNAVSPDGHYLAYWIPEKHELHVVSNGTDTVVDTLPGTIMREIVWAGKGRTLAYFVSGANPPGVRVVDLDSGKRQIIAGNFTSLTAADAEHIVGVGYEGVHRISISDARRELVAPLDFATAAAYSRTGALLGILAPDLKEAGAVQPEQDDDAPDCTGGTSTLFLQVTETRQLVRVPFPKGFDTVHDFAFAPDERSIAVTFGAAACDYPGDVARVYLVSLPDLDMRPVSPIDRLSVKAKWSPDGKVIVYSDYTGSNSPLLAFEVTTGKTFRLTNPGDDGPDEILGWRVR